MATCSFFGHRNAPESIRCILKQTLTDLIENKDVDLFYVGHNGIFDLMVLTELKQLSSVYANIKYFVVIYSVVYPKSERQEKECEYLLFPDGLEAVPKRFAIDKRNQWMVNEADYVVTYVTRSYGGAHKFKAMAERKKKTVINLADMYG